jgi:hypothetical protein
VKTILELGCVSGVLSYHYKELDTVITYVTLDIIKDVKGWSELLSKNGFDICDESFLNPSIIPYNFRLENSVELIFRLK